MLGRAPLRSSTSPPVMAAAMAKVPVSMRSGITSTVAPCSSSTPSMVRVRVPMPEIFAPMATRHSATLVISGSCAAFSMTVVPRGQRRRHQDGVGGADRDLGEHDAGADEAALGRLGDDIALVDIDLGAELLEAEEEEIDRARADGAAAGQRDAGLVAAGEQRPDDPEAGAHLGDELVGRGGVDDVGGMEGHALADRARPRRGGGHARRYRRRDFRGCARAA